MSLVPQAAGPQEGPDGNCAKARHDEDDASISDLIRKVDQLSEEISTIISERPGKTRQVTPRETADTPGEGLPTPRPIPLKATARQNETRHICSTVEERIERDGVTKDLVVRYLKKEISEHEACMQLPWAILVFCCFCLSMFNHTGIFNKYALDLATRFDIEENANFAFTGTVPFENGRMGNKNIYDVNSYADFWSWLNVGLVPLLYGDVRGSVSESRANVKAMCVSYKAALEGYGYTAEMLNDTEADNQFIGGMLTNLSGSVVCPEDADPPAATVWDDFLGAGANPYLYFNWVVGGLEMARESAPVYGCSPSTRLLHDRVYRMACLEDQRYFLDQDARDVISIDEGAISESKTFHLQTGWNTSRVLSETRRLENEVWLAPNTNRITLMLPTYNPHWHTVTVTFMSFFLNPSGHIHKSVESVTAWCNSYSSWYSYVFDFMWLLLLVRMGVLELLEITKYVRQLGFSKGMKRYWSFWNFIDWLNIVYAAVLTILWSQHLLHMSEVVDVMKTADVGTEGSWAQESERQAWFDMVHEMAERRHLVRSLAVFYPFVTLTALFKPFSGQPRLAIMVNTLARSASDLAHFLVVFLTICFIYVIAARLLFGQKMSSFSSFSRATVTVFQCLVGDVDWNEMIQVGRAEAIVWYVSFQVVTVLIALNMLMAIVMDKYSEVKSSLPSDAETLWSQTYEIFHTWRQVRSGRALSLQKICKILDPTDLDDSDDADHESETFRVHNFLQQVEGMKEPQAIQILKCATVFGDSGGNADDGEDNDTTGNRVVAINRLITKVERDFKETIEKFYAILAGQDS